MNTKQLLVASLSALMLGVGGVSLAAASTGNDASMMQHESPGMEHGAQGASMMGNMMGKGMMGGGMMGHMMGGGMMGGCPMMGAGAALSGKAAMQMHGEMMRAMGDILIKYADKLETPPVTK
ncbi:hypothetical protein [Paralcaligenes ureilyticus]|uniref:Pentapeptide MXKDX repeat protein n=1 Tax=Paralcaligenes ureilyticus TaxID=627131 RepID=A0A4R3M9L1_9BURK|nr:hypothetical protein [Paralcaligenes ureilyticus]TCT10264.1 hypothetical protein EDC26_102220 [Paralcaligenes ureilyticus]